MTRLFATVLPTVVLAGALGAQQNPLAGGGNPLTQNSQAAVFDQAQAALGSEGQTLDVVQVPMGWGDGRVTERDARALARYCVWGFNRVLEAEGIQLTLDQAAEQRMIEFWVYVWDHVDLETKQVVTVADVIWPRIYQAYELGDPMQRRAMVVQFAGFMEEIWGGLEDQTVQYLAGMLPPQQYAMLLDQAIREMYAASGGGGGGGGSGVGGSMDVIVDYAQAEGEYVMNDGSGDIVYPDN